MGREGGGRKTYELFLSMRIFTFYLFSGCFWGVATWGGFAFMHIQTERRRYMHRRNISWCSHTPRPRFHTHLASSVSSSRFFHFQNAFQHNLKKKQQKKKYIYIKTERTSFLSSLSAQTDIPSSGWLLESSLSDPHGATRLVRWMQLFIWIRNFRNRACPPPHGATRLIRWMQLFQKWFQN